MRVMLRWGPVILLVAGCGGGGSQVQCNPRDVGGPFCVPDAGRAANLDVKLQLRDECTSACDMGTLSCEVRFDGGSTIELALTGVACFDPNTACPAVCGFQTYSCTLPPIPDGTYTVTSMGQSSQQLTFGPGGAPGCQLP